MFHRCSSLLPNIHRVSVLTITGTGTCRHATCSNSNKRPHKPIYQSTQQSQTLTQQQSRVPPSSHRSFNSSSSRYRLPITITSILFVAYLLVKPSEHEDNDTPVTSEEFAKIHESELSSWRWLEDLKIWLGELLMGYATPRKQLLQHAYGDVLDVGCGTGRNLWFLPPHVTSFTGIDRSSKVLSMATSQSQSYLKHQQHILHKLPITWKHVDVDVMDDKGRRLPFDDNSYDTVIDTMGLCCYADPIAILHEMSRVCQKSRRPTIHTITHIKTPMGTMVPIDRKKGLILLLEHGRTYQPSLDTRADVDAHSDARSNGCYGNRDILHIVQSSGLHIVYESHDSGKFMIIAQPP